MNFDVIVQELFAHNLKEVISFALKLFSTIVILIIGWWIINQLIKGLDKILKKREFDNTVRPFLVTIAKLGLRIMFILAIASTVGISTASFVAAIGAAGLALGLALQGSLANFAGGILLLVFRPIRVDDYVKAQGQEGFIKEINLFTTVMETPDNITIYIPNGVLANGNIINVSQKGTIRLHIPVGIGYGEDIKKARAILLQTMVKNSLVLTTPAPQVAVVGLGDNSVDLMLRPWCNARNAPVVSVTILEEAKIALDEAGIDIPYPQRVIHTVTK